MEKIKLVTYSPPEVKGLNSEEESAAMLIHITEIADEMAREITTNSARRYDLPDDEELDRMVEES